MGRFGCGIRSPKLFHLHLQVGNFAVLIWFPRQLVLSAVVSLPLLQQNAGNECSSLRNGTIIDCRPEQFLNRELCCASPTTVPPTSVTVFLAPSALFPLVLASLARSIGNSLNVSHFTRVKYSSRVVVADVEYDLTL